MNKYRRRAVKKGELHVSGAEISRWVELSRSKDPNERLEAANYLCPCHVRKRIGEVWDALFRLLEDPDVGVRKAAFHTVEDGGDISDPALVPIFERVVENETDPKLRKRIERFLRDRRKKEQEREDFIQHVRFVVGDYPERDKCDFCGEVGPVQKDFDTTIPGSNGARVALICKSCD